MDPLSQWIYSFFIALKWKERSDKKQKKILNNFFNNHNVIPSKKRKL